MCNFPARNTRNHPLLIALLCLIVIDHDIASRLGGVWFAEALLAAPSISRIPGTKKYVRVESYCRTRTFVSVASPRGHGSTRTSPFSIEPNSRFNSTDEKRETTEMVAMTTTGLAFSGFVVYILGTSAGETTGSVEVMDNILDAALPLTPVDVVAVALAEGIAGIVGAIASFLIQLASSSRQKSVMLGEAVADSNFFVASASALPIFRSIMSGPLATLSSALLAIVPYEIFKATSREKIKRQREEVLLQQLLDEELATKRRRRMQSWGWLSSEKTSPVTVIVDVDSLEPVEKENGEALVVEVVADVIKWLGYGALSAEFSGKMMLDGMPLSLLPGAEGVFFGMIVGTASQVYTDVLYGYFGLGGDKIMQKVRGRSAKDWLKVLLSRTITTGTLFGVYEVAQIPAKTVISSLLSGGYESCVGSEDYNMCAETFLAGNPPQIGASPEAEFRALATSIASLWSRYTSS